MPGNPKKSSKKSAMKPKRQKRDDDAEPTAVISDKRFAHVHSDPRFQIMPKEKRKFRVDSRFKGMFKDDRFKSNYTVDAYGRKVETDTYGDDLHRYYNIDDDDDEEEDVANDDGEDEQKSGEIRDVSKVGFEDDSSDDSEDENDEDDSSDADSYDRFNTNHMNNVEDIPLGDETLRIAVVNLEWDRLRAVDLLVLFQSFVGEGDVIERVDIYSSEYGRTMMKLEAETGPQDLWVKSTTDAVPANSDDIHSEGENSEDDGQLDADRLRSYETQKLRYYVAVVTCSSLECSSRIYAQCDGMEFEQTSNILDLRFIPAEVEFHVEHIRDSASEVPSNYVPSDFYTSSLKHTNVKCSWDVSDPNRDRFFKKKLSHTQMDNRDIEVYLAPAESDGEGSDAALSVDESDGEGQKVVLKKKARNRYLGLLEDIDSIMDVNSEKVDDITVSFEPGLSNIGQAMLDSKKRKEVVANETVWEARQRKRKERKRGGVAIDDASDGLTKDEANDPFFKDAFNDDLYEDRPKKAKELKKAKKAKKTKDEVEEEQRSRAELELLVLDEGRNEATESLHRSKGYNVQQLIEAHEGSKKRRKNKRKLSEDDTPADGGAKFDVNNIVKDDRFKAIFKSEAFAIDPTDPAFKNTQAMSQLQEIRQQQRKQHNAEREEAVKSRKHKAIIGDVKADGETIFADIDVNALVRKLKNNATKSSKRSKK